MTQLDDITMLRDMPGYWYIATPFAKYPGGHDMAYLNAVAVSGRLRDVGVRHYCPIAMSYEVARDTGLDPCDLPFWIAVDRPFMDAACGLVVATYRGWEQSEGIAEEIKAFVAAGKPVYRYQPHDYPWIN